MTHLDVKRYLGQISKSLPCDGKTKKKIMAQVSQRVTEYLMENPEADYEALVARIGAPRDIAMAYVDAQGSDELLSSIGSNRKHSKLGWVVAAVMLILLGAALFGDTVHQMYMDSRMGEDVKAVLQVTMNTPNAELFDPDVFVYPGMDPAEKELAVQKLEEMDQNWESRLGQYFSPGSFDLFLNSYIRSMFFVDDPKISELQEMTLVSIDEGREVVETQVKVGGVMHTYTVTFLRNPDGLLYRVEIEEKR